MKTCFEKKVQIIKITLIMFFKVILYRIIWEIFKQYTQRILTPFFRRRIFIKKHQGFLVNMINY